MLDAGCWMLDYPTSKIQHPASFSNTEGAKDTVQEVVGVDGADNFAQFRECDAQFGGGERFAAVVKQDVFSPPEGRLSQADAFAAASGGGRHNLPALRGSTMGQ
jgi:hypothetical protein